jgi:hypothetical protein
MNGILQTFLLITINISLITVNSDRYFAHSALIKKQDRIKYTLTNKTEDSITLTAFVRQVYKWHNKEITNDEGFEPKKRYSGDTIYKGLDFDAINFMINKLRRSGFFDETFLTNYRNIGLRMNKELKTGKVSWREGDLPPFNEDADPWCSCKGNPGNYWNRITLADVKFNKDGAVFKWTWGNNFYYNAKARKENGNWKITYLEGFDFNHYHWADQ